MTSRVLSTLHAYVPVHVCGTLIVCSHACGMCMVCDIEHTHTQAYNAHELTANTKIHIIKGVYCVCHLYALLCSLTVFSNMLFVCYACYFFRIKPTV